MRRIVWVRPSGLPRVSGGVSVSQETVDKIEVSSPRKRGCFRRRRLEDRLPVVFPA